MEAGSATAQGRSTKRDWDPYQEDEDPGRHKVTWEDLGPVAAMGLMLVGAQLLAVWIAGPFVAAGLRAFEDPEDPLNPILYFGLILLFTIFILVVAKFGFDWVIQGIILFAIGAVMVYVFWPLLNILGIDPTVNIVISIAGAVALTVLLYKWPEWYVVDSVGILVSAGAVAIFGVSFGVFPAIILMVGLAIYDFIAVYKTKHMLSLADRVVKLRLPIMLVVPKTKDYSFLEERAELSSEAKPGRPRDAMFMGLGDIVIPSILIVVAFSRLNNPLAAVGALVGTFIGFVVLMQFVLRGKPHAGLPLLNGGSILGFFVAFAFSGQAWAELNLPGIG
jgi:presenilin-like A22 family membrane protease